jgi:hypothetical protein
MKAGGKLLEQERQEQLRKLEEEKEKEKNWLPPPSSTAGEYSDFDLYGGTLKNSDPDLFQLVRSAIRFFTK